MDKAIQVLAVGSPVEIGDGVAGVITAVSIRGQSHRVTYEVAWWSGSSHNSQWLEDFEVKAKQTNGRLAVGFAAALN